MRISPSGTCSRSCLLLARSRHSTELEILVLRHKLAILRRQTRRPQLGPAERALLAARSRALPGRAWTSSPVTPQTLLRWRRQLVARRWTQQHVMPGRPPLEQSSRTLILCLARENPSWSYRRIRRRARRPRPRRYGDLSPESAAGAGLPPAPQRGSSSWRAFLRQQAASALACDFLTSRPPSRAATRARRLR
jgi:putative transposase